MKIRDLIPTLTGFEEIGIEQVTGYPLEELSDEGTKENPKPNRNGTLVRAMAAVVVARRDEVPIRQAWTKVQTMTREQVGELFPDEDEPEDVDVIDEDEPTTAAGKDDAGSMSEQPSSLPSSSGPA